MKLPNLGIVKLHKDLINSNSDSSSSRYMAIGTFYVASTILLYFTFTDHSLVNTLWETYIITFALTYLGSKGVSTITDIKKGKPKDEPTE